METKIVVTNSLDAEKVADFIKSDAGRNILRRMTYQKTEKKAFWQKLRSIFIG